MLLRTTKTLFKQSTQELFAGGIFPGTRTGYNPAPHFVASANRPPQPQLPNERFSNPIPAIQMQNKWRTPQNQRWAAGALLLGGAAGITAWNYSQTPTATNQEHACFFSLTAANAATTATILSYKMGGWRLCLRNSQFALSGALLAAAANDLQQEDSMVKEKLPLLKLPFMQACSGFTAVFLYSASAQAAQEGVYLHHILHKFMRKPLSFTYGLRELIERLFIAGIRLPVAASVIEYCSKHPDTFSASSTLPLAILSGSSAETLATYKIETKEVAKYMGSYKIETKEVAKHMCSPLPRFALSGAFLLGMRNGLTITPVIIRFMPEEYLFSNNPAFTLGCGAASVPLHTAFVRSTLGKSNPEIVKQFFYEVTTLTGLYSLFTQALFKALAVLTVTETIGAATKVANTLPSITQCAERYLGIGPHNTASNTREYELGA
jgi:hypothetical protein